MRREETRASLPVDAIVLAGGFGTRLRAVVSDVPKPMAPVAGRPFLEHVLAGLAVQGVSRTVLSVGYRHEQIVAHFGTSFEGMELTYEIEQQPLGTGGAVAASLRHCRSEAVLVLNGDTWLDLDLAALVGLWQQHHEPIIVARRVTDVARYGALEVAGDCTGGRVLRFAEKGSTGPGLINAGTYLLPRNIFGAVCPAPPFAIESDFLAHEVGIRFVRAYVSDGEFIDIGVPEDYRRAQTMRLSGFKGSDTPAP